MKEATEAFTNEEKKENCKAEIQKEEQ
jgi:hypothetical protein